MISAIILAKNAEKTVDRALASVKWCGEVLVVDDMSTDRTAAIAKKAGARVIKHPLGEDFAAARTHAESKAKGDWALFLDADEEIDTVLADDIQKSVKSTVYPAFALKRVDTWFGTYTFQNNENGEHWITRLYKKGSGKWHLPVHEEYRSGDLVGKLDGTLRHYAVASLSDFIAKIARYAALHSKAKEKKYPFWFVYAKPFAKFVQVFFRRKAYRDTTYGFVLATFMSFHSFLAWSEHFLSQKKT